MDTTTNTDLGIVSLSNGVASLSTASLPIGTDDILATYSGDGMFLASIDSLIQIVSQDATTTTLTTPGGTPIYGQAILLSAQVQANAPGSGTPTGMVDFVDTTTNTDLGSVAVNASGVASLTTTTLPAITNTINAVYAGDGNYLTSTSSSANQTVQSAITSTANVGLSSTTTVYGQPVTLTATVANTQATAPVAGIVSFMNGLTVIGTAPVVGGIASLTVSSLARATYSLKASFTDPAGNFVGSISPKAQSLKVSKASTTTTLAVSDLSPVYSEVVTFTAMVTANSPSGAVPTGSVVFKDGTTTLKTVTLDGTGSASFAISTLAVAGHSITAVYSATTNFMTSTSTASAVTVSQIGTTTTFQTSLASPVLGQSVTFTATVAAVSSRRCHPDRNSHLQRQLNRAGNQELDYWFGHV